MSDIENKLRSLAFREPPQDIRRRVLAATPRWTWRDWFWPSPVAWGAIAAVWLVALATEPSAPSTESSGARPLLAIAARYHQGFEFDIK